MTGRNQLTERLRPLLRTRQVREFTPEPPSDAELDALTEVARWSGSSRNSQPWRFIVIRDPATLARIHEIGLPQTHSLGTARAAIAIVLADDPADLEHAFDEGRAAERLLISAGMLGLGAGIAWILTSVRPAVGEILGLPGDHYVRTVVAIGHATEAAQRPKSAPGAARLPKSETVLPERWRQD
ncbi:MAG: nitroreductase family protein [Chloroflexota bacterium]